MKVSLIKKDGKTVGYEMQPETHEDKLILGSIRQMQFWGFDSTKLVYAGISTANLEDGREYVNRISWVQEKHHDDGL